MNISRYLQAQKKEVRKITIKREESVCHSKMALSNFHHVSFWYLIHVTMHEIKEVIENIYIQWL